MNRRADDEIRMRKCVFLRGICGDKRGREKLIKRARMLERKGALNDLRKEI
jgi:hypothetical protein